jgi:hypothetical protein
MLAKNLLHAYCYIDMHWVVVEFSYVDCVLVSVVMGFLVKVIRLGLSGVCSSWLCCPLRYVWIVAIQKQKLARNQHMKKFNDKPMHINITTCI